MPMAPAIGVGTDLGMSTVPGMGMDPTAAAAAGLGVTPGLGLGIPNTAATVGLGAAATATPPIATECLLVSNLFDTAKSALLSFLSITYTFFSVSS